MAREDGPMDPAPAARHPKRRRLLVIDDGSVFGEGVRRWLREHGDLEVAIAGPNGNPEQDLAAFQPEAIIVVGNSVADQTLAGVLTFLLTHPDVQLLAVNGQAGNVTYFVSQQRIVSRLAELIEILDGLPDPP